MSRHCGNPLMLASSLKDRGADKTWKFVTDGRSPIRKSKPGLDHFVRRSVESLGFPEQFQDFQRAFPFTIRNQFFGTKLPG